MRDAQNMVGDWFHSRARVGHHDRLSGFHLSYTDKITQHVQIFIHNDSPSAGGGAPRSIITLLLSRVI